MQPTIGKLVAWIARVIVVLAMGKHHHACSIIDLAKIASGYFKNHDRCGHPCLHQECPKELTAWTDADFAGCRNTRNSTSRGALM
eukprot:2191409-Pyramimonas_sp.AAC.1